MTGQWADASGIGQGRPHQPDRTCGRATAGESRSRAKNPVSSNMQSCPSHSVQVSSSWRERRPWRAWRTWRDLLRQGAGNPGESALITLTLNGALCAVDRGARAPFERLRAVGLAARAGGTVSGGDLRVLPGGIAAGVAVEGKWSLRTIWQRTRSARQPNG